MREVASDSPPPPPFDFASRLPLHLLNYDTIPPAPSRSSSGSEPAVDFLLDFAGYSWIAYGASSLLVISHFPNPILEAETKIAPIYRQVIELSREAAGCVSAVSWSPVTPSVGELAVALGDCIVLLTYSEDEMWSGKFVVVLLLNLHWFCWISDGNLEQKGRALHLTRWKNGTRVL